MKKLLIAGLILLFSLKAFAFDQDECAFAAESIFHAQSLLNADPQRFAEVHKEVKAADPAQFGASKELHEFIVLIADALKPGNDPRAVGMAVFNGCKSIKSL